MANKKASAEALKECQLEKTTMLVSTKERKAFNDQNRDGYVPLYSSLKTFYIRNFVRRLRYILYRPIALVPGATVAVIERDRDYYNWSYLWTENKTEYSHLVRKAQPQAALDMKWKPEKFTRNWGKPLQTSLEKKIQLLLVWDLLQAR
jgi:hypothetical protein